MTPSNSGSRNGIITWAVIATILGLGSLIWAIISFTTANKAQADMKATGDKYRLVGALNGDAYTTLNAVRDDTARGYGSSTPLLDVAVRQTGDLTKLIAGAATTDDKKATAAAQASVAAAQKAAGEGTTIDGSSLTATIDGLTTYVSNLRGQVTDLTKKATDAEARATAAETSKAQVIAASNAKVEEATKAANESQANAAAYKATIDAQLNTIQGSLSQTQKQAVQGTNDLNGRIADLQQQLATKDHENADLRGQLKQFRVPADQIIQQADGAITKVAGTDIVYINLGTGDQIAAGMTFEVYDKAGVPHVTSDDPTKDALLKGKASIEVIKVNPGISECRVVRSSPGTAVTEGDPIVNVVYDKNVKFNFVVYGKFNLDYRGDPTEEDANVIRRLISRWGAQVAEQLDSKTDFLVLGDEPVVPAYTTDELAREPEKAFQKEQSEKALEQYQDLRNKANQLNIPILNQTRFLYMIGYYEEAAR